ncbi:uncharacterized protein LOC127871481 isoform X2 [Dreissena polymorpha]|uniref:uncharacterized protein LOC127871481 isoform X2 n=1 Tax=Dreissena polymorpha TaxID=45954 RepID=UPI002264F630|nr:uncharacterized protein LOC127871481 isoform X2 [Dreissena polymorpha]
MDQTLEDSSDEEGSLSSSVFETPILAGDTTQTSSSSRLNAPIMALKGVASDFSRSSMGLTRRRLDTEDFENISMSAFEETDSECCHGQPVAGDDALSSSTARKLDDIAEDEEFYQLSSNKAPKMNKTEVVESFNKRPLSDESRETDMEAINEDSGVKYVRFLGGDVSNGDVHLCEDISESSHLDHNASSTPDATSHVDHNANTTPDANYKFRKHSSGDLHSRLKTRKLLGVGETDDGDVHRSKLSQILGHSDQLYIRLPNGLRLWLIILSLLISILAVWALLFPSHYFSTMYDVDGSTFAFPVRLYACALISIAVMYWSTVQASDRDVIRTILLSSVVFFALQICVLLSCWLPWLPSSHPASVLCSVVLALIARLVIIAMSSYFYWITHKDGKSKDVKYFR